MELLLKAALLLLLWAALVPATSAEASRQLYLVTVDAAVTLSPVAGVPSLRVSVPRSESTGRALVTIAPEDLLTLQQQLGIENVNSAVKVTLELSGDSIAVQAAVHRLGG